MKKICLVTATRAEYGLLRPLMFKLKQSQKTQLQVIVTGTHVEKVYGETVNEIIRDGFVPDKCIPIVVDDTPTGILSTMSNATKGVGEALKELGPDLLVLLGDRYETFAIASSAVILGIPIVHLYGGEVTYGAYDEVFRHAITKMSYLHFTSTEEYRKRVIQMGESPDRVFNVGALGVENVLGIELLSKEELERQINFSMNNTLLATFHPVTMEMESQEEQFKALLDALAAYPMYNVLFTRPNADTNRVQLNVLLDGFGNKFNSRVKVIDSLGVVKYLSAMKYCAGVIGNSSSGIVEAPSMKVGTINIGNRQKGRIGAKSIIHCNAIKEDIIKAFEKLSSAEFKSSLTTTINPYEGKETSKTIAFQLEKVVMSGIKPKEFYDI